MVQPRTFRPMDLFEIRRQLVQARNRHSDSRLLVRRINGLLCSIYHLEEVLDPSQHERIRKAAQIALRATAKN